MAIEFGLSQKVLPDIEATLDFTSGELSEAPKAVLGLLGDGATNGTANPDLRMSMGGTDGSRQNVAVANVDDALSKVDASRLSTTDHVMQRLPNSGGGQDELSHYSFLPAGSPAGWRASHTNPGGFGKLALAAMFGGSDVTAEVGKVAISGTSQITKTLNNTSLTPNVLIVWSNGGDTNNLQSNHCLPNFGIAIDNGVLKQRCITFREVPDSTEADPALEISTTCMSKELQEASAATNYELVLDSLEQGQFKFTPTSDPGGGVIGFMALQIDNAKVDLVDIDTPTTTGAHEETGPGFQPKFVIQALSMLTAMDTIADDATAGAFALSMFNSSEAYCYSWSDQDGADTTVTQSLTHDRPVYYDDDSGDLAFDAIFSQFTANGWELNYGTVDGTARKGFALAVGPSGIITEDAQVTESALATTSGQESSSATDSAAVYSEAPVAMVGQGDGTVLDSSAVTPIIPSTLTSEDGLPPVEGITTSIGVVPLTAQSSTITDEASVPLSVRPTPITLGGNNLWAKTEGQRVAPTVGTGIVEVE